MISKNSKSIVVILLFTWFLLQISSTVHAGSLIKTFKLDGSLDTDLSFSPNGNTLAFGYDKSILLFDIENGKLITTLENDADAVASISFRHNHDDFYKKIYTEEFGKIKSVAFSPNGKILASSGFGYMIKLWSVEKSKLINTLKADSGSMARDNIGSFSVVFSPDGKILASSGYNIIELWSVENGKLITTIKEHSDVWGIAFSPDGKTLAIGSMDKTIKLLDIENGKLITTLKGHTDAVASVAFSPDGKTLASGSGDKTIKLWDIDSGALRVSINGHSDRVQTIAFSPDGKTIASGGFDNIIKVWDIEKGKLITTLKGHADSVTSVAFSPDGKMLASAHYRGAIKLWDVENFSKKATSSISNISNESCRRCYEIKGEITPMDAKVFQNITDNILNDNISDPYNISNPYTVIYLDSAGGNVKSAIEIGKNLRELRAIAVIRSDSICYSSCVYILAGATRRSAVYGSVGIHRPFSTRTENVDYEKVKQSYKSLYKDSKEFLSEMNIPPTLFDEMMRIPSEQVKILTKQELKKYGLSETDPVFQDYQDSKEAGDYKLSKIEYLKRKAIVEEKCTPLEDIGEEVDCINEVFSR